MPTPCATSILSVGSSPATYGMATMAAVVLPSDASVGGGLFCTTWASAMLLLWAPKVHPSRPLPPLPLHG